MNVLLIWEDEDTSIYLLRNLNQEDYERVRSCHNHYLHRTQNQNVLWLSQLKAKLTTIAVAEPEMIPSCMVVVSGEIVHGDD